MKTARAAYLLSFQEPIPISSEKAALITTKTSVSKEQPDYARLGTMTKTKVQGEGPDDDPSFFMCFAIPREGRI